MTHLRRQDVEPVHGFAWRGGEVHQPWSKFECIADRLAYVLMDDNIRAMADAPDAGFVPGRLGNQADESAHAAHGAVTYEADSARFRRCFRQAGLPVRNSLNKLDLTWDDAPFVLALRQTDAFGEILLKLEPTQGRATAWSITINRKMQAGFAHSSPMPEEQMINRIGTFDFAPIGAGRHTLELDAFEKEICLRIDGQELLTLVDPDVAAGRLGVGALGELRIHAAEQLEYISPAEITRREDFVRRMNEFCRDLDLEYPALVAQANEVKQQDGNWTWRYPETGATLTLTAAPGGLEATLHAGLYGNPRLLHGAFMRPKVTDTDGLVFTPNREQTPELHMEATKVTAVMPLLGPQGKTASLRLRIDLTQFVTWFWTAEVEGIDVASVELTTALDPDHAAHQDARAPLARQCITDAVTGHFWKQLSEHDTTIALELRDGQPLLTLRSAKATARWGTLWLPFHAPRLEAYKKRMLHFIRYPQEPVQQWRERPSREVYPTDEELYRFKHNGVKAMVWHHTWAGNNFRERDGFVVNEPEMRRAMRVTRQLDMETILYIGIVPGRHPALRYEDLAGNFEKNWDLQDFCFYSVGGRWNEFLPFMADHWCREYDIDGFYADGGLAGNSWGICGRLGETDDGLTLEELEHRLYTRVTTALRRRGARFGLENWGGDPIRLVAPFYNCRMIGESFQERTPQHYRDLYNPLLTGTPFKMYGMDLTARNRYNIAMAAVCMTDIQLCSGNHAWGNWPDRPADWQNLRPWWQLLDGIDWDHLLDARPWWAQQLVRGEGFYAGNYTTPQRAVFFLANVEEEHKTVQVRIDTGHLPKALRQGSVRQIYPQAGQPFLLGQGAFEVAIPRLHDGPLGFEITA